MLHDAVCVRISLVFSFSLSVFFSLFPPIPFFPLLRYCRLHLRCAKSDRIAVLFIGRSQNLRRSSNATRVCALDLIRGYPYVRLYKPFVHGEKNTRSISLQLLLSLCYRIVVAVASLDMRRCRHRIQENVRTIDSPILFIATEISATSTFLRRVLTRASDINACVFDLIPCFLFAIKLRHVSRTVSRRSWITSRSLRFMRNQRNTPISFGDSARAPPPHLPSKNDPIRSRIYIFKV